jgi:hypothetical protein
VTPGFSARFFCSSERDITALAAAPSDSENFSGAMIPSPLKCEARSDAALSRICARESSVPPPFPSASSTRLAACSSTAASLERLESTRVSLRFSTPLRSLSIFAVHWIPSHSSATRIRPLPSLSKNSRTFASQLSPAVGAAVATHCVLGMSTAASSSSNVSICSCKEPAYFLNTRFVIANSSPAVAERYVNSSQGSKAVWSRQGELRPRKIDRAQ